ncbi:MAG: hypothetical protein DWQ34_20245 [Planctomycetota bacterium]|nr:MAG: hypothetical protein DWQ29_23645 [Planctomycetota bacterium]REJ89268.1 MAG: hypothetical protein DWQ34_20245 [Planctomycetota bacterium]REK29330.1 MAG: hypothetical protein DWQ41_04400 [Planctomycetota bacterium]REK35936.1 MAG: hypothetical protein DWQ45_10460 [Planctomycetota bacterium]
MSNEPILAYARLNARIMPFDRGERYEDPLQEALEANRFAEVTGGGTMQSENGEIDYCGIDLDIFNRDEAVPFICDFLAECGAPKGSVLQYEFDGRQQETPFGFLEGLAIYFNGTDLPDEVYEKCDINHVYDEVNRLLDDRGEIQGHWQGPTETALYLYGYSASEMRDLIAEFMVSYPLCDRARYATIA